MPVVRIGPSCASTRCSGPVWDADSGLCAPCWYGGGRPDRREPAELRTLAAVRRDWDAGLSRLCDQLREAA